MTYITYQGGTWSRAVQVEVYYILVWAERHVLALSAVHIPVVENWHADFLNHQQLIPEKLSLHPEVFSAICHCWGWMWIF